MKITSHIDENTKDNHHIKLVERVFVTRNIKNQQEIPRKKINCLVPKKPQFFQMWQKGHFLSGLFQKSQPGNQFWEEENSLSHLRTSKTPKLLGIVTLYEKRIAQKRKKAFLSHFYVCRLSQSATSLDCGCPRVGMGKGHGCATKLVRSYYSTTRLRK